MWRYFHGLILMDFVQWRESVKIYVPKNAVNFSTFFSYHSTAETALCTAWLRGSIAETDGNCASLPFHTPTLCLPVGHLLATISTAKLVMTGCVTSRIHGVLFSKGPSTIVPTIMDGCNLRLWAVQILPTTSTVNTRVCNLSPYKLQVFVPRVLAPYAGGVTLFCFPNELPSHNVTAFKSASNFKAQFLPHKSKDPIQYVQGDPR